MNEYIIDGNSLSLLKTLIGNLIRSGSLNFVGLGLSETEILSLKTRLEVLEKHSGNQKLSESFEKLQDSLNNVCSNMVNRMESDYKNRLVDILDHLINTKKGGYSISDALYYKAQKLREEISMESRGLKEVVVGSDGVGPFDEDLLYKACSLEMTSKKKKYSMSQKKASKIHYYLDQLHTIYLDIDVDDKKADKIFKLYNDLEEKFNLEQYWLENPRTF